MEDNEQKRAGVSGLAPPDDNSQAYDATQDPRTGRPPNPLQAQQLAQEREANRSAEPEQSGEAELGELDKPPVPDSQAPARMTPPEDDGVKKAAIDALIQEGITREQAEALVDEHGTNWETLKAAAFAIDPGRRSQ